MKSAAQALARWQQAGGTAAAAWSQGIQNTTKDQAALAAQAQPAWLAGVQDAAANNRFANGVTRRGTGSWKSQSEAKQGNYTTGYAAGGNNFSQAITKIIAAEGNIVSSLPARGPAGSPGNYQRSNLMGQGLHQLKGQLKAGN